MNKIKYKEKIQRKITDYNINTKNKSTMNKYYNPNTTIQSKNIEKTKSRIIYRIHCTQSTSETILQETNNHLNISDFKQNTIVSKLFLYYSNEETDQENKNYNKDKSTLIDSTSEFLKSVPITGNKIIININNDASSVQKSNDMIRNNFSYFSLGISRLRTRINFNTNITQNI